MPGAMELLPTPGRDDLRVVRYRGGSIPDCHVLSKLPVVDAEVDPPL